MNLIGNVLKPLAKSVLIPLGLTAAASAKDAAIHKKMFGSAVRPSDLASRTIFSNEEMNDIMEIVNSLELSSLLIKGIRIVLLTKSKLNRIEVLISKSLIDSIVLINNELKEYDKMKEEIKKSKDLIKFSLFTKQCYRIA